MSRRDKSPSAKRRARIAGEDNLWAAATEGVQAPASDKKGGVAVFDKRPLTATLGELLGKAAGGTGAP